MIRTYCDRCGIEIPEIHDYISSQTQYIGDKFDIEIFKNPVLIGELPRKVHLCRDCKNTLEKMVSQYFKEFEDVSE